MVSIIIVNYNTLNLIFDCIDSIFAHTVDLEYEIIVVDNNSQPDFEEKLQSRYGKSVRTLPLKENVGFGRANNAAFSIARGDKLFCLNPDTILLNNAIKILSDFIDRHPSAGICGGNLYNADMRPVHSFRRILPGVFWELSEGLKRHPERLIWGRNTKFNHSRRPLKVGYITGADIMIRKDALEQTGGFSDDFFMYFEETDLCARMHKIGWKIYSVPKAKIMHLEGGSFSVEKQKIRQQLYLESKEIYYKRNLTEKQHHLANRIYNIFHTR